MPTTQRQLRQGGALRSLLILTRPRISITTRKHLQAAKQKPNEDYNQLEIDRVQVQIEKIAEAAQTNNTATAWKIVNTGTNRKTTLTGKLKAKSPEEMKTQWLEYFKSLFKVL